MFVHFDTYRLDFPSITTKQGRTYNIDGNKFPSITTVLGIEEPAGLTAWKQSVGKTRADKIAKEAAERGTSVHQSIEQHLQNIDITETKREYISSFNQIKPFLKRINNIECQENVLFSMELEVAGRVDCIAEYNGKLSVIDFKTSTNLKHESIIENYFIQASAYAWMFYEMFEIEIEQIVIMITVDKGLPQVFVKDPREYYSKLIEKVERYYELKQK